jgi:hypothetical protein
MPKEERGEIGTRLLTPTRAAMFVVDCSRMWISIVVGYTAGPMKWLMNMVAVGA